MFYAQSTIMVISGWRLKQKLISGNFWTIIRGLDSRNGIWNAPIGLVMLNWCITVFIQRWKITKPKTKFANVGLWYWLSLSSWEMMETSSHAVMTKKQKTILIKSARAYIFEMPVINQNMDWVNLKGCCTFYMLQKLHHNLLFQRS